MNIKNVHIGNFGKLKEYSLNFDNGLNILYGNNEDGKSTIMAFIKLMFYGNPGRSSDLSKNFRKKYLPWDGSKMSGSIEFEHNGITYRLEKIFGASNASDKISLWNKTTGEKENIAGGTDIGQRFFGLGAAAFEKSVFIGQAGSMADTSDKEDEITQRLLNLVSTGDESVSHKKVENRLQSAMEQLKSKSGKIGILDKQYQELNRLSEARSIALEEEEQKKKLEKRRAEMEMQLQELEERYQDEQSQYDLQKTLGNLRALEKLIEKKQSLDLLIADYENKKKQLFSNGTEFDEAFVKSGEAQILQIQSLEEIYSERKRNVRTLQEEVLALEKEPFPALTREAAEEVNAQTKRLAEVQVSLAELKEAIRCGEELEKRRINLQEAQERFSLQNLEKEKQEKAVADIRAQLGELRRSVSEQNENLNTSRQEMNRLRQLCEKANTEYLLSAQNKKSTEQLSNQKIETARAQLEQSSALQQEAPTQNLNRSVNLPLLAGAVVLLILSVALGVAVQPLFYAGAVVAAVLGGTALFYGKKKSVAAQKSHNQESLHVKENYERVCRAAETDNLAALEMEQKAVIKLKEAKAEFELIQQSVSEWEQLYERACGQLSRMEQKEKELAMNLGFMEEKLRELAEIVQAGQAELQALGVPEGKEELQTLRQQFLSSSEYRKQLINSIQERLSACNCETIEQLQAQYMKMQNHHMKSAAKTESLEKACAEEKETEHTLEKTVDAFLASVRAYQPVSSYEAALRTLNDLKNLLAEMETLRVKMNSQKEYFKEELQGKTTRQIESEADELRRKIAGESNGVLPQLLPDEEYKHLAERRKRTFAQLQEVRESLIQLTADIKNQFSGRKNVSELEEQTTLLKKEMEERESDYQCLSLAQATLSEAFAEIRQSFGPLLNKKTAEIFSSLTAGKYQNVMISRNFDINVQEEQMTSSHEWQYLSSGTIDQAYLSLRLAVADLLSQEGAKLPLLLDDVFLQYDDTRAEKALAFLAGFSKRKGYLTQIILFTCHKSNLLWAEKNGMDCTAKSIHL